MKTSFVARRDFIRLYIVTTQVSEEEAVDIIARQYGVLLMPGKAFGAPGYL
jgi:aspartate/methionine/tyrosine aminotransferase